MARARSRSSRQGSARGEQDQDVAAATRADVGNTPAAEACHEPRDRAGLGRLTCAAGSPGVAAAGQIEVKGQHPPGGRAGVVDGHRARLARRIGG